MDLEVIYSKIGVCMCVCKGRGGLAVSPPLKPTNCKVCVTRGCSRENQHPN